MSLSTHVLDLARGKPATGILVVLETMTAGAWRQLATATTDDDGRCSNLLAEGSHRANDAIYRLRFETGVYFARQGQPSPYPYIEVVFIMSGEHHHLPLLLAANGYTTYRGS